MRRKTLIFAVLGVGALAALGALTATRFTSSGGTTVAALAGETHFHGLAVDANDPERLYLATHHGLYAVGPDGAARRVSEGRDDFMGFTPHPTDATVLFASGHPAGGGNLGVIVSRDGGVSWTKLADGLDGPVDFHQMDASKADPNVIYGVHGDLQKSSDGGRTWRRVGPPPEGMIDLAVSARDPDVLYAATRQGLLRSADGGRRWRRAYPAQRPATMVDVSRKGDVYAFVAGTGLVHAREENLRWEMISGGFGRDYILHFAVAPADPRRLYAVVVNSETRSQTIQASRDGGATWTELGAE